MKNVLHWIVLFVIIVPGPLMAQVSDLSFTLAPTAEYIFRDNKAGLQDGFVAGGGVGFGFGQFVELSGVYLQSINLKTDFSDYGFAGFTEDIIPRREVDWLRYGGELRVNLSKGTLLPFLTLGSGVQRMDLIVPQSDKIINEQIYLDMGAGIVLSMADRYTLTLAGKNAQYRHNSVRGLMTEGDREALDLDLADYELKRLSNWALNASLQFYIGGQNPHNLTAADRAYRQHYGGGLAGFSVPIEPVGGQIKFHEKLPYRDTWYVGLHAGVNLGDYIGLRGFYWQGLEEDQFRSFDKISLYGGEAMFNLSRGDGITPFLTLGGGYLNVGKDYVARPDMETKNQPFAMGGVGLTLPLSPYFKLFGGVRAMLLSDEDLDDLAQPTDVLNSWNYHFGMRLIVGKKAKKPEAILDSEMEQSLNEQQQAYQTAVNKLNEEHTARVDSLRKEVQQMKAEYDSLRMAMDTEKADQVTSKAGVKKDSVRLIHMTPEELNAMMKVITEYSIELKKLDVEQERIRVNARLVEQLRPEASINVKGISDTLSLQKTDTLGKKGDVGISRALLERMMEQERASLARDQEQTVPDKTPARKVDAAIEQELRRRQNDLERDISILERENRDKARRIDDLEKQVTVTRQAQKEDVLDSETQDRAIPDRQYPPGRTVQASESGEWVSPSDSTFAGRVTYQGFSSHVGIMFGQETAGVIGFRTNFGIRGTDFRLVPETWIGLGSRNLMGFSVQGLYSIKLADSGTFSRFRPYLGVGAGLQQMEGRSGMQGLFNVVVGTDLQLWEGRAFVDYTLRNFFDYNQIVLGYRFPF